MKKILYLSSTDWGWAKQRPQFLAEALAQFFEVEYVFQKKYKKKNIVKNNALSKLKIYRIFRLPFDKFRLVYFFNKILAYIVLDKKIKKSDYIWITHPSVYDLVKKYLQPDSFVIYDCMDDHLEFPDKLKNEESKMLLFRLEQDLLNRADITFISSEYLMNKIKLRYFNLKRLYVINNAISKNVLLNTCYENEIDKIEVLKSIKLKKIIYIGTISEWFDFGLLLTSLNQFENIIYVLFGPTDVDIPHHERLLYIGPISHSQIIHAMSIADLLVMPFSKSELIYSVNPVKLYEYLIVNKPVIILKYGETLKFNDFVYLYDNEAEFLQYIDDLSQNRLNPKQKIENCLNFVNHNTWNDRIDEIVELLDHDNKS